MFKAIRWVREKLLWIKDADRFSKLASGWQSIAVISAILIGGGWTLWVFESQLTVQNARAQLAKLRQDLGAGIQIETTLHLVQLRDAGSQFAYLSGTVVFKNQGNHVVKLSLPDDAIKVARAVVSDTGEVTFGKIVQTRLQFQPGGQLVQVTLNPGFGNDGAFIVKVPRPGVYLVSCYVEKTVDDADGQDQNYSKNSQRRKREIAGYWGDSTFVRVN